MLAARLRSAYAGRALDFWAPLLKAVLLAGLGWAIYHQVWARDDLGGLYQTFLTRWQGTGKWYFLLAVLLVPVNWGIETQKWRCLLRRFTPVSFWKGFRAVLAGVAISLFTPNRMGEYGGRVLAVELRHGWKAVLATLVGSMSQWLALFAGGLLGLAIFSSFLVFRNESALPWIFAAGPLLLAAFTFLFFQLYKLPLWLQRLPFYSLFKKHIRLAAFVHRFRKRDLASALALAGARYLTYTVQYYLLLCFFGIGVSPLAGFAGISTLFLFQTSLPLPPVVGLFARGEAALFVWGQFSDQPLAILAASFGLFILNLAAPALLGGIVIVQTNVSKLLGYEEKEEVKVDTGSV